MLKGRVKMIFVIALICWIILTIFILFLFWLSRLEVTDKPGMIGDYKEVLDSEHETFEETD